MKSDLASNYRGENAEKYASQVNECAWYGHEILFGFMYQYVKADDSRLDIELGTG